MIRHIIFDMGGVLTEWDPEKFMRKMGLSPEDRELIMRELFREAEWAMQDMGLIDEAETFARVTKRLPKRLHGAAETLIFRWDELSAPIPGMAETIRKLKENGCGIWLLSNASVRHPVYWKKIAGNEYFDGLVVSSFEKLLKPDLGMYRTLLSRFALKAEECVFTDDTPVNVAGALACGIDAFVFRGADDFVRKLRERGVKI